MELKCVSSDGTITANHGSNRTFMELKCYFQSSTFIQLFGSNRTFMELKLTSERFAINV